MLKSMFREWLRSWTVREVNTGPMVVELKVLTKGGSTAHLFPGDTAIVTFPDGKQVTAKFDRATNVVTLDEGAEEGRSSGG